MPIQWVNAKDIMRIHNEINTEHPLFIQRRLKSRKSVSNYMSKNMVLWNYSIGI